MKPICPINAGVSIGLRRLRLKKPDEYSDRFPAQSGNPAACCRKRGERKRIGKKNGERDE